MLGGWGLIWLLLVNDLIYYIYIIEVEYNVLSCESVDFWDSRGYIEFFSMVGLGTEDYIFFKIFCFKCFYLYILCIVKVNKCSYCMS